MDLENIENHDDYELVIIELEQIAADASQRVFVLLASNEKKCMIEINSYEASMMSFAMKDLHRNSHIQTIHQLLLKYLGTQDIQIDRLVIESKVGDIVYATMSLVDSNHRRIFSVISLADAMILSLMTKRPLHAVKKVWDEMDEFDEWDYEYYTLDDEDEED
jgi:bifunctional DNase/RNase